MSKYEKAMTILLSILIILWVAIIGIVIYASFFISAHDRESLIMPANVITYIEPIETKDLLSRVSIPEETLKPSNDEESETTITENEKILIAKLVQAEAGNQDAIGKRLIVDVVLNRVDSIEFPNSIKSVIYQDGQFANPSWNYCEGDLQAVEEEITKRLDENILYFRTEKFHTYGEKMYQHGDHYFSGKGKE